MARFIKLTKESDGDKVLLNYEEVKLMEQSGTGTTVYIYIPQYTYFNVTESVDEIMEMISGYRP